MHIHVPKPLHGWKAFLNEIFVIVIGILIAIGFEQVVEQIHWQHKVAEGEDRLKVEGGQMFKASAESVVAAPCVIGQLQQMQQRVVTSDARLNPTPLTPSSSLALQLPPSVALRALGRNISPSVWDALRQDGTVLHMPVRRQRRLSIAYNILAIRNSQLAQVNNPSQAFGEPIPLDAQARVALLADLSTIYNGETGGAVSSARLMGILRDLGLAPPPDQVDTYIVKRSKDFAAFCRSAGLPLANWRAQVARVPSMDEQGYD